MKLNLPKIIGHRGAAASAPENTLSSLQYAADHGVRWVEIDVMATGDNELVVHHDLKLGRCNNGEGEVIRATLEQIQQLDAGSWFSREFCGEKVPSLGQAIDLIGALGLGLNLEIKAARGQGTRTATLAADYLKKNWPAERELLISSFNPDALDQIRLELPDAALGVLSDKLPDNWRQRLQDLKAYSLHSKAACISEQGVREVRQAGYKMLAYTVNDSQEAERLLAMGIDGIISDCPDKLIAQLRA